MVDKTELGKVGKSEKKSRFSSMDVNFLTKAFKKVFNNRDSSNQDGAQKKTLALGKQIQMTQKIIDQQSDKISELAETDESVADFKKNFDSIKFDRINEIVDKLEKGESVSEKQGKELVQTLENLQTNFDGMDFDALELNAEQMTQFVQENIQNEKLSRKFRAKMIGDLTGFLDGQEELTEDQTRILGELKEAQEEGLVFTQEQTQKLSGLVDELGQTRVEELKTKGTLNDINEKMGSFVTNQREIEEKLGQEDESGQSLKDSLEEGLDSTVGQGLLDTAFAALGLPGLASALQGTKGIFASAGQKVLGIAKTIFGKSGVVSKLLGKMGRFGKFIGRIFKPIGSLLGKLGKLGPVAKVAGRGARVIPVVGQVIGAIMSLFSAVTGFLNADEISGKKEKSLTLLDKFQASISNVLSSLTLGFIDASTIFDKIEGIKDWAANFDLNESWNNIVDAVTGIFDKVVARVKEFVQNLSLPSFSDIKSFFTGSPEAEINKGERGGQLADQEDGGTLFDQAKSFFSGGPEPETGGQGGKRPSFRASSKPSGFDQDEKVKENKKKGGKEDGNVNYNFFPGGQNQGDKGGSPGPQKRENIDDLKIATLNMGLME